MTSVNSKPFQSAVTLQSARPTANSVTRDLLSRDASEARYWAEKFGLGNVKLYANNRNAKFAHPRSVVLNVGSAAVVHQIVIGSTAASKDYRNANHNLVAAVCGPRVPLYGTTPQSAFHRALSQHGRVTAESGSGSSSKAAAAAVVQVVEADRQVPTGGQLALSAYLRADGRLLAIGTDAGIVRVADTTTRATLCQFQAATRLPVRAVRWFRDGQRVLAAGDDGAVRVWQLIRGSDQAGDKRAVLECKGHGDAVRCAVLWQKRLSHDRQQRKWPCHAIAATGSYDHTIRLWNMENLDATDELQDRCMSVLQHGGPVEAVEWINSTNPAVPIWLVSAGGTTLKVWNPVTGACVCTLQAQHRKTVTCMLSMPRRDNENKTVSMRLITAGLDGLMRIHAYDLTTGQLRFVHGISLNGAITSLAATFTGDRIAIGTAAGTVLVRQMGPAVTQRKRSGEPTAGTFSFFTRGMNAEAATGDHIVSSSSSKKRKLAKFDLALKQFRYGDALDEALETRIPQAVVAVLEELGKRRGLTIALSNRDEESIEPILAFTVRYVTRPRFSALLIGVANKLIDIYAEVAGQSERIDELFVKLKDQVTEEIRTQKTLFRVVGQLDAILAQAEMDQRDY